MLFKIVCCCSLASPSQKFVDHCQMDASRCVGIALFLLCQDHVAGSGRNFQGALSPELFSILRDHAGVTMETFAAPQFAIFDQCCSAFRMLRVFSQL